MRFFLKERLDLEVHERIAYEFFAYLWGVAVLQEDPGEIKMWCEGCLKMVWIMLLMSA